MLRSMSLFAALAMISSQASAELINVNIQGSVAYSVIQGNQLSVPDGAPVEMSFNVDSDVFTDSAMHPTRGYDIILNSFSLSVGGQPIQISNPQPNNQPAYFVLRDNDPVVDGFFISPGTDLPFPLGVTVPGLAPVHELDFSATYNSGSTLSSLDILDAVGTYDLSGISSYVWTVGRFGNPGAEYDFQTMTISTVPAPASLGALATVAAFGPRRRRRAA